MMLPPADQVYLACGFTDMRKGFDGLAALVQTALSLDPYGGARYCSAPVVNASPGHQRTSAELIQSPDPVPVDRRDTCTARWLIFQ